MKFSQKGNTPRTCSRSRRSRLPRPKKKVKDCGTNIAAASLQGHSKSARSIADSGRKSGQGRATRETGTGMGFRTAEQSHYRDVASKETLEPKRSSRNRSFSGKRLFDIVLASALFVGTAPLLAVTMLLIRIQDGERSIFSQKRIGKDGKTFNCYKLRTMVPDAQSELEKILGSCPKSRAQWESVQKLDPDPRITQLGRFLRKSSIDELPQLVNVLKGDMSLVGPRPIVPNEIKKYGAFYQDYCSVKPGITGLWQIKGRSNTTYEERVSMDVEYAQNQSLWSDVAIFLGTIPAVLFRRGAR